MNCESRAVKEVMKRSRCTAVAFQNGDCIDGSPTISDRWAGRNHVQRIAEDIGDDEGDQAAGTASAGQTATFDPAELFANGVELLNIRTARAEKSRHRLLFGQRNAGNGRWQ